MTEGALFSGTVATFADGNPLASPTDFTATIDWGDGHTSNGTVSSASSGGFEVSASHTYDQAGQYLVNTAVTDVGGSSTAGTVTASVSDAPLSPRLPPRVETTAGAAFSGTVATFADGNPLGSASDLAAIVDWGDGHTSNGTVSAASGGGFQVAGSHTYEQVGTYAVTVAISDAGGATTSLGGAATVGDAPMSGAPVVLEAFQGVSFSGAVATFTDENPFVMPSQFTATIDWGDGSRSSGSVVPASAGGFQVNGTHTFSTLSTDAVTVEVVHDGGSSTAIHSSAQVGAPPAPRTSIVLLPAAPNGLRGWYTSRVHAAVLADGLGVPVSATRCELDPKEIPPVFDSLAPACLFGGLGMIVGGDGRHTLYAASVNVVGEKEPPVATAFGIDSTPPTVRCDAKSTFVRGGSGGVVGASVTDSTSGPVSLTVVSPANLRSVGDRTARLVAQDNAGNTTVTRCAYRVLGHLNSAVEWGFAYHRHYTIVTGLVAHRVPVGSRIRVFCAGGSCPFTTHTVAISSGSSCRHKACASGPSTTRTVQLSGLFKDRRLSVHTRIEVSVAQPNTFGSAWIFTVLPNRAPAIRKTCLAPGSFRREDTC